MSKKPVPSKKQAVSSTRSRYKTYVRKQRTKLENGLTLDKCPNCEKTKKRHFACEACGKYRGHQVLKIKQEKAPIQEIEA